MFRTNYLFLFWILCFSFKKKKTICLLFPTTPQDNDAVLTIKEKSMNNFCSLYLMACLIRILKNDFGEMLLILWLQGAQRVPQCRQEKLFQVLMVQSMK